MKRPSAQTGGRAKAPEVVVVVLPDVAGDVVEANDHTLGNLNEKRRARRAPRRPRTSGTSRGCMDSDLLIVPPLIPV